MPCEIVGLHFFADSSELHPVDNVLDTDFIREYAIAHEEAGFDRVLIGQTATWPDGITIASHIAAVTTKLKFMIAHRPGFIAPTMAARMFATLDQLSNGRVGVHIITGASDVEMQCDGDFHTKDERYKRSREYVDVLRQIWQSDAPSNFAGDWYRFNAGYSTIKPKQESIPIYWGGGSELAVKLGAECADTYAIGPGTVEQTAKVIENFKAAAAEHGRNPGISMSMRVIVGETEEAAWQKAQGVLDAVIKIQSTGKKIGRDKGPDDLGAKHMLAIAEQGDCLDERLWTGITKATEGRLHAMALVGTAEQVSDALMLYYQVGVDRFLLNGFDTINDVRLFGQELIPLIREKVAMQDSNLRIITNINGTQDFVPN
ncbi:MULTISPECIES: LLM class flavin-dependent oxidoreductase [Aliiglaciecola]|uniref:LLM class flavin-dependent oxidoreductase n=1 Tax=Aliiglaciecola TaxID=1406885 RepID=UPI001C0A3FAB|nr:MULTISPECIES: LLM class flavin-dependent oxidoreductase [Aliiglaciecola]MBU2878986.1 LLM class flavin-dependent oxidoreductase [Aliiglaciecola lipolytica]MDO6710687.1 LLM class flavin-dependent oxidoreductase [Aliiglaciecola sp. 2_MG-2023]MDO6751905.1 LLM class flavin-dependent oxidoreductase [Aliiglaciecola sp. 1_MG-2023]